MPSAEINVPTTPANYSSPSLASVILTTLAASGLVITGIGLAAIGGQYGWWPSGALSHLTQFQAWCLTGSGGTVSLISFVILSVKKYCHSTPQSPKAILENPHPNSLVETPPAKPEDLENPPSASSPPVPTALSPEGQIRSGLQRWIDEAPDQEKGARSNCRDLILECFQKNASILDLSNQNISSLPPEMGQLTQLRGLNLSNNQLTSLPPEIWQLTKLKQLILSNNQLISLPPEIWQLTKLNGLYLRHNQLTLLPPEIWQLTQLEDLFLNHNQLTSLPPKIGQLTQLKDLDLSGNQLTSLPEEILQLLSTCTIYLEQNPFSATVIGNQQCTCNAADYNGPRIFFPMYSQLSSH